MLGRRRTREASPTGQARLRRGVGGWLPPLCVLALILGLWQLLVTVNHVKAYLLPAPWAIVKGLVSNAGTLRSNAFATAEEMLLGLAISICAALALGIALHLSSVLRRGVYPLVIASQTIPIVVLAPILVILLGFGIEPKLVIIALLCFFPVVVGTVDGLRSVDPRQIDLMLTLHASRWAIFRRVEFPSALPSIFSGLRIAVTYAPIGAVFAEWAGSTNGLGYVMLQAIPTLQTTLIFDAVVILSAMSLTLFGTVTLLERYLIPWSKPSTSERQSHRRRRRRRLITASSEPTTITEIVTRDSQNTPALSQPTIPQELS